MCTPKAPGRSSAAIVCGCCSLLFVHSNTTRKKDSFMQRTRSHPFLAFSRLATFRKSKKAISCNGRPTTGILINSRLAANTQLDASRHRRERCPPLTYTAST